jgi:YegS/Rv2252/BmrU family lipid kinase
LLRLTDILFIINPASARGNTVRAWNRIEDRLRQSNVAFSKYLTNRANDATEAARNALAAGVSRIVSVGGDGTLNEIVNGYFDSAGNSLNPTASLSILPSGTGSDFRRTLGVTEGSDSLAAALESGTRQIDVVHAEFAGINGGPASRFFINVASFGLGGEISATVNRWRETVPRWIGGSIRFTGAAISALGRYRCVPVTIRLDESKEIRIDSNLIIAANARFAGGGMMVAPNARIDDGLVDVILTDGASRWDVVKELPRIQRGAYLRNPRVSELRARQVEIESAEPLPIDMDGEMVGYTPARLVVRPAALRFAMQPVRSGEKAR